MLVPQTSLPLVEVLDAHLQLIGDYETHNRPPADGKKNSWDLKATLYFVARQATPIVLAGHKHSIEVAEPLVGRCMHFRPLRSGGEFLEDIGDIVIDLPTRVKVNTYKETTQARELSDESQITFSFSPAGDTRRLSITSPLRRTGDWIWELA